MKLLNFKTLGSIAAVLFISSTTIQDTFAQRGRSSNGGGGSAGRSAPSRSSAPSISRSSMGNSGNRSAVRPSQPRSLQGNTSRSAQRSIQRNENRSLQSQNRSRINPNSSRRPNYAGRPTNYRGPVNSRPHYGRPGYGYGHGYGYRAPFYGRFYNYYRPYLGFSLSVLPFGYYPFYFGQTQFFYSGGLYYRQYEREYKVVVPPVGAEVPSLPEEAQEVTVNGKVFYEYKGVYYQARQNDEGKTVYVIAGKDGVLNTADGQAPVDDPNEAVRIGDEVQQLPEGSAEVTLKGAQYFVSPDGVYYEKVVADEKVSYKVVGL
ncbi:hypothetical protein IWX76_000205 [Pedobacter sp. CAN_A7]|uniref:DUF6515 family protein n=1 Tax=Pedobacter sp. CAN_A7 TaxID=2787722 RepID=UPI0018CB4106